MKNRTVTRGTLLGAHRLDTAREALVNKIIEQEYLSRSPPTVEEIVCIAMSFALPSPVVSTEPPKPVTPNEILNPLAFTHLRFTASHAHERHGVFQASCSP